MRDQHMSSIYLNLELSIHFYIQLLFWVTQTLVFLKCLCLSRCPEICICFLSINYCYA